MDLYACQLFDFGDFCFQYVVMVILDLWTVRGLVKVELKSASTIHMAASVLTFGMKWMPRLSVDSWDS